MNNGELLTYEDLEMMDIDSLGLNINTIKCLKWFFNISKVSQLFILWFDIVSFVNEHFAITGLNKKIIEDIKEKVLPYEKSGMKLGMSKFDLVTFGIEDEKKETYYVKKQIQILNSICNGTMKINDLNVPEKTLYHVRNAGVYTVKDLLSYSRLNTTIDEQYINQMQKAIDLLGIEIQNLWIGMGTLNYFYIRKFAHELLEKQYLEAGLKPTKKARQLQETLQRTRQISKRLHEISEEKERLENSQKELDENIVSLLCDLDFTAAEKNNKKIRK